MTISGSHSPYDHLPRSAFWRTGVQAQPAEAIADLYRRKFEITPSTKIATAGSCFAQRVTRHLRERGFCVIDQEPAPPGLRPEEAAIFGYGLYSARYANIYTARHLRQLTAEAFDAFQPADAIWRKGDRYYDAMRPSVEPTGLLSPEAVSDHRRYHLRQVRQVILSAEVFVFTLGMTEAWIHAPSGTVYPTAPGVIGTFDGTVTVVAVVFVVELVAVAVEPLWLLDVELLPPPPQPASTVAPSAAKTSHVDSCLVMCSPDRKEARLRLPCRMASVCAGATYMRGRMYPPIDAALARSSARDRSAHSGGTAEKHAAAVASTPCETKTSRKTAPRRTGRIMPGNTYASLFASARLYSSETRRRSRTGGGGFCTLAAMRAISAGPTTKTNVSV